MDATQDASVKSSGSGATLVTLISLGAGNIGFAAGIFGRTVGEQTLYAATATGTGVGAAALTLGLTIASFLRKGGEG